MKKIVKKYIDKIIIYLLSENIEKINFYKIDFTKANINDALRYIDMFWVSWREDIVEAIDKKAKENLRSSYEQRLKARDNYWKGRIIIIKEKCKERWISPESLWL